MMLQQVSAISQKEKNSKLASLWQLHSKAEIHIQTFSRLSTVEFSVSFPLLHDFHKLQNAGGAGS